MRPSGGAEEQRVAGKKVGAAVAGAQAEGQVAAVPTSEGSGLKREIIALVSGVG
jgi:hypothetical protein